MAFFSTKTYSKRNNEGTALSHRGKENIDPFDELLSSPLKQNVQFQPLSFWGKNVKDVESEKSSISMKWGLYETSDSDDHTSPFQRRRKLKSRYLITKTTLQPKTTNIKSSTRRNNNKSNAYSSNERKKFQKSIIPKESKSFEHIERFVENKSKHRNKNLYCTESVEEALKSANKVYDNFKYSKMECFNIDDTTENFYSCQHLAQSKGNNKNIMKFNNDKIHQKNFNFKIFEDFNKSLQSVSAADETFVAKKVSIKSVMEITESMEETLNPFLKDCDSFKFISTKRHFNYPSFYRLPDGNFNCSINSIRSNENQNCSSQSLKDSKCSCSLSNLRVKDENVNMTVDCMDDRRKTTFTCDDDDDNEDEYYINNSPVQIFNSNVKKNLCSMNSTSAITEGSEAVFLPEGEALFHRAQAPKSTFSDSFNYIYFESTKAEDPSQEMLGRQNANARNSLIAELSSTSDDTLSELNDENTVIRIGLESETSPKSNQGFEEEIIHSASSNGVSYLTNRISDLTISNATDDELSEPEGRKSDILQGESNCTDKEDSFLIDLRNVTTKRRGFLNNVYGENVLNAEDRQDQPSFAFKNIQKEKNSEIQLELERTISFPRLTDRMSLDWNKTFSFTNPVFESTRVLDMSLTDRKISEGKSLSDTVFEESSFDPLYVLKPGKKWLRSMSILKQLQNGNISEGKNESARITGRKFESFIQDVMEMQNVNRKIVKKTCIETNILDSFSAVFNEYYADFNFENSLEGALEISDFFSNNGSIHTENTTNKTVSEKVLLNRTVKVIQPKEGSIAFRSALGLETSHITIQEDLVQEESSCISARNFILIQCGQEDVLPFEEYFNENTLVNCKKIGEGVYGEVFMCSDTVIKIMPIEGSDKVNGEPQKTFEEIISEVVIASKLSNLRNGEKHRTDGFTEMKRCWCVKGKYPKYLLNLWNEYDQLGSGSENDSPVMFRDDQLYMILELANGGKDLESFVFNSAAQSVSALIQAAFSLAVAEKAFEFEHRDLHWGNILISDTKDKTMTVVLDGTEYKIPTKGVKVCIIDFTLSRMSHEGCCIFNDLSVDPGLFTSEGDYQFEIYRMMLREVKNDWSLFRPKNNLFWLHYILDKMIKMVRYKNKKAKVHAKHLKDLRTLESIVLEHKDSTNFVLSSILGRMISRL